MEIKINEPESWKVMWRNAIKDSKGKINRANAPEKIERWDKRAKEFAMKTGVRDQKNRQNQVLNWLKDNNGIKEDFKVLDIGAGTGRYAIAMAEMGCKVVAVEPAKGMVGQLKSQVEKQGIKNITVVHESWQNVNLKKYDFEKEFDLVFASMTPGIQMAEDIDKMIQASKNACYLSTHTKNRWADIEYVMTEILQKQTPNFPGDFLYRYCYVYTLGYIPITTCFQNQKNNDYYDVKKQKQDLMSKLTEYIDVNELSEETLEKINDYFDRKNLLKIQNCDNKISSQSMLWFV